MKTLSLLAMVAVLAACETAPEAAAPERSANLTAADLRGTWAVQAAEPAAGFRADADSFALGWARELYVGHARVTFQPDGALHWEMKQMPVLFAERRLDTTLVYGSYHLRHQGPETWLNFTDFDTDRVRLRLTGNTLVAEDPDHHLRLTLVR